MRTYHDKAVFVNQIYVFDMIREYLDMARGVDAPFPETSTGCSGSATRSSRR